MATESALWQSINALGGVPASEYDRGFNDAIVQVLTLVEAVEIPTAAELIADAGKLNNHPKLAGTDHVSFMGLMSRAEMVRHVAKLRALAA